MDSASPFANFLSLRKESEGIPVGERILVSEVFDHAKLCLYVPDGVDIGKEHSAEPKARGAKMMIGLLAALGDPPASDARHKVMVDHLLEYQDHTGAMAKSDGADLAQLTIMPEFENATLLNHPGVVPWLATWRTFKQRYGSACWPILGCGGFILPANGSAPQVYALAPMATSLSLGTAAADLPQCLSTQAGLKYTDSHLIVTRAPHSCALWVPWGVMATPIALRSLGERRKIVAKTEPPPTLYGEAVVFNPMVLRFAMGCDESSRTAVINTNIKHLERRSQKKVWRARCELIAAFSELLAQQPKPDPASSSVS